MLPGDCVENSAARKLRVAFFSEEPSTSEQGCSPPFLRLLCALPGNACIVLNVPAMNSQVDSAGECSHVQFSFRPAYAGSYVGFLIRSPGILGPTARCIRRIVSESDVVVAQFPSPIFPLVVRAAKQLGTPYILYVMGDIREVVATSGKYPRLIRRLIVEPIAATMHRLAVRASSGAMVIAASQSLAKQYALASYRSIVFTPSSISGTEIVDRQDTCLTTPIRLLFVGRLVPVKGLAYLIEALALLVDDGLSVHLELVGAGPQRGALESLAAERGIASVVEFSGEIPFGSDLLARYRMADIFVLPSLSEGTPRVLWEAMASGVPIVTARVGGIPDLIRHGETGLLVNPHSPGQLAESIRRLIEDKELRQRLIQSGYSLVERHTVERQASTLWENITTFLEASRE